MSNLLICNTVGPNSYRENTDRFSREDRLCTSTGGTGKICQQLSRTRPLRRQQVKPRGFWSKKHFEKDSFSKYTRGCVVFIIHVTTANVLLYCYFNVYRHLYLQVSLCHTFLFLSTLTYYYCYSNVLQTPLKNTHLHQ